MGPRSNLNLGSYLLQLLMCVWVHTGCVYADNCLGWLFLPYWKYSKAGTVMGCSKLHWKQVACFC